MTASLYHIMHLCLRKISLRFSEGMVVLFFCDDFLPNQRKA